MAFEFDQFDFEDLPVLTGVRMWAHIDIPSAVCAVEFSFQQGKVYVWVDEEFDTLVCSRTAPTGMDEQWTDFSAEFWNDVAGNALTNAWRMTSDRGYPDALQLRFRSSPSDGNYRTIQLYGEASQITFTELAELRRLSLAATSNKLVQ